MVFLLVGGVINRSRGHSSEDLNCFPYPQLPFITLAAGYFTLAGGLDLTGTSPKRFMLEGGKKKTQTSQMDLNWWVKRQRNGSSPPCRGAHSELTSVRTTAVCGPRQSPSLRRAGQRAGPPGQRPFMCFELRASPSCRTLSCEKHKDAPKPITKGRDAEPELERRHLRRGSFWRAEQTALLFHCCLT